MQAHYRGYKISRLRSLISLEERFSNSGPRNTAGPPRGIRGVERPKFAMAEEFYLCSQICVHKLQLLWRHSTPPVPSLTFDAARSVTDIRRRPFRH
jgi:hypothetical protein